MPAIRYQHNYRSVVLSDENLHLKHPLIPAFLKDGSLVYYPFGGFVRREVLTYEQYVKLTFISAFSPEGEDSA